MVPAALIQREKIPLPAGTFETIDRLANIQRLNRFKFGQDLRECFFAAARASRGLVIGADRQGRGGIRRADTLYWIPNDLIRPLLHGLSTFVLACCPAESTSSG